MKLNSIGIVCGLMVASNIAMADTQSMDNSSGTMAQPPTQASPATPTDNSQMNSTDNSAMSSDPASQSTVGQDASGNQQTTAVDQNGSLTTQSPGSPTAQPQDNNGMATTPSSASPNAN